MRPIEENTTEVVQGAPTPTASGCLVARLLPLDTFRENVVVLSRRCAAIRPERLLGLRKVEVRAAGHTPPRSTGRH